MNKKFHISKFTNKETIYNTLDAIDPDGEKMKKAKAYMEEQGYDPSKSSEVEKVFEAVKAQVDEILDTHSDEEIDANDGDNELCDQLDELMELLGGLSGLEFLTQLS